MLKPTAHVIPVHHQRGFGRKNHPPSETSMRRFRMLLVLWLYTPCVDDLFLFLLIDDVGVLLLLLAWGPTTVRFFRFHLANPWSGCCCGRWTKMVATLQMIHQKIKPWSLLIIGQYSYPSEHMMKVIKNARHVFNGNHHRSPNELNVYQDRSP